MVKAKGKYTYQLYIVHIVHTVHVSISSSMVNITLGSICNANVLCSAAKHRNMENTSSAVTTCSIELLMMYERNDAVMTFLASV